MLSIFCFNIFLNFFLNFYWNFELFFRSNQRQFVILKLTYKSWILGRTSTMQMWWLSFGHHRYFGRSSFDQFKASKKQESRAKNTTSICFWRWLRLKIGSEGKFSNRNMTSILTQPWTTQIVFSTVMQFKDDIFRWDIETKIFKTR